MFHKHLKDVSEGAGELYRETLNGGNLLSEKGEYLRNCDKLNLKVFVLIFCFKISRNINLEECHKIKTSTFSFSSTTQSLIWNNPNFIAAHPNREQMERKGIGAA